MKYIVIGGDAAGMSAASRAKRNYPELQVVVFEQSSDVSYSACGMPYNIADPSREMEELVVRRPHVFREKQGIDVRLGHCVTALDPKTKTVRGVTVDGREFEDSYDKLLIAAGARARRMGVPGEDLAMVRPLRTLEDGRNIKRLLAEHHVRRALIVGAGYIGLEMAEAFRSVHVAVEIGEFRTELLPWMPREMAALIKDELDRHEVTLSLGMEISEIRENGSSLEVLTRTGKSAPDLVLVGVGVDPCSEIARLAGLELGPNRSIAVDEFQRTSDPDVSAAGDCADAFHAITGRRVWIPLAPRANRSGWAAADNLFEDRTAVPGIMGTAVFKVFDMEVARTGLSVEEAGEAGFEPCEVVIKSRSRAHAHPGNQDIHVQLVADKKTARLLGGQIVGREGAAHRINSLATALHAKMSAEEFFQCDFGYAPPFSPVWDPLLTAANQMLKQVRRAP